MQLSALVLKSDNPLLPHQFFRFGQGLIAYVKFLLPNQKAFSHRMTIGACACNYSFAQSNWEWNYRPPSLTYCPPVLSMLQFCSALTCYFFWSVDGCPLSVLLAWSYWVNWLNSMCMLVGMANWALQFGALVGGLKLGQLQSSTIFYWQEVFKLGFALLLINLLQISYIKLLFDQLYENTVSVCPGLLDSSFLYWCK